MKVALYQRVRTRLGLSSVIARKEIDWPPFLQLPSKGDTVGLPSEDGYGNEYDVHLVGYWPDGDSDGSFATIEFEPRVLNDDEGTPEDYKRDEMKGWE